ncbi:MAG: SDR family NAD(P)-dependent oxidoreductase [Chloroflexota bacterium]|nr:SDR family NAD(P)-dependent oxidoreductase [Chloroflexota bacterium]
MPKVVVVTGASGYIGSAIAARFALEGGKVTVHYHGSRERAEQVAKRVNEAGGEALVWQADIRRYPEVKRMVDETVKRWGRLDVMVSNAGGNLGMLGGKDKLLVDLEEEAWDLAMAVNLTGAFYCVKAAAPQMMQQKEGHIVLVASGTGLRGKEGMGAYAASKMGVIGLMKTAARELGNFNIKVNALHPGRIMHGSVMAALKSISQAAADEYLREAVLHHDNNADEFADFIFHLTEMQNVSGQSLNVDSRILS